VKVPPPIAVGRLLREPRLAPLKLRITAGKDGIESREIINPRIQKPGLALAGYLPYVKAGRVQILGESEYSFLETLGEEVAADRLTGIVDLEVPCLISSKGNQPPQRVIDRCNERNVPFLTTMAQTSDTIEIISGFLEDELAPRVQMHGVLLDVFSLGTLIVGDAGIGKSECALELVYRGHRLVADDLVMVRRTHNRGLMGSPHDLLQNYLELRGVGIIDIRKHFGMTATQPSVTISLVIQLIKLSSGAKAMEQKWREQMMERPRAWTSTEIILEMEIPKYTMVVAPGRDVAIMVETAVRKCLLAQRGIQDERDFLEVVNQLAEGEVDD
jgi:HPr kinase/phosphorylase